MVKYTDRGVKFFMGDFLTPKDLYNKISGKKESGIADIVMIIVIILLMLLLFLKTFVFTTIFVSGRSMEPTLYDTNFLIADTLKAKLGRYSYGDVIVVDTGVETTSGDTKKIIKRIIGLEGDEIDIKDGYVYRNGVKLEEEYLIQKTYTEDYTSLPEEYTSFPHKVGKDEVFVLGDNRLLSLDSRRTVYSHIKTSQVFAVVPKWSIKHKDIIKDYYGFLYAMRGENIAGD